MKKKQKDLSQIFGYALHDAKSGEFAEIAMTGPTITTNNGKFTWFDDVLGIRWDDEKICDYCNKKGCFHWDELDLYFCKKCLKKFVSKEKPIGKIIRKV
jgi:hypothetical protein